MNRTITRTLSVLGAVAVVAAAVVIGRSMGDGETKEEILITPRAVERRDLSDVLTVSGEVRRDEIQEINSAVDGKVSSIAVEDGQTIEVGDTVFALDGRAAVAVNGDFAFFRQLEVGSDGPDVLQLEEILVEAGYDITDVDTLFTEETRVALSRWQFDRGYGGARPENDETVTVSLLSNPAGYSVGKSNTVAFTIVPSVPTGGGSSLGRLPRVASPTLTISASTTQANEGSAVTFTITSSVAPVSDLSIDLTIGGDADGGESGADGDDYTELETSVLLPAGSTSVSFTVDVFVDQVIEDAEDIVVSLTDQFGNDPNYVVGPTNSVRVVIPANGSDLRPEVSVKASGGTVDEGSNITFTLRTTVESNRDVEVEVEISGSATPDVDYVVPDEDAWTIPAGATSVDVSIQVRRDDTVEVDETLAVRVLPDSPASGRNEQYFVGDPASATVDIVSPDLPELTIVGGGTIAEGGSGSFRIVSDAPVTADTSVNYQFSGTAQPGSDFEVLSGTVVMRAGSSSVTVVVRTIDDDVVFQPSDMLVAAWPARVGKVEVDEGEFVLQGQLVLSLTEPDFTITMKVSPSDRAELEVGQEVTVDLQVGGQLLSGVISELDDSASVGDTGEEQYEGVVQVDGELDAVDGASVTIDVVLEAVSGALAVPVASVLRTSGGDEVRVVGDDGTIDRVPVTIGLIDGEWVEIVSGLRGNELVIVDIDAEPAVTDGG